MVYYLGHYNCEEIKEQKRSGSPAGISKMRYVISALEKTDALKIQVVSPSETVLNKIVLGCNTQITKKTFVKTFLSFSSRFKIIRGFGHIITKLLLWCYMLKNIKSDDYLIVYHSLYTMNVVKFVKKIKHCQLILEVEEIYSDVQENAKSKANEMAYFQNADKFIAITKLLSSEINPNGKPYIISHGKYDVTPHYADKFDDGKIHVIYAGSFDLIKGGAYGAVCAAEYLDENYVLHVLGGGTKEQIDTIKGKIDEISSKTACKIEFNGYKSGVEFDSFVQSCHIGLSTQQPDGAYNASSFPSKILMYMCNGISVVSVRIPAVETSAVGEYISYYDGSNPKDIAAAIKNNKCFDSNKIKALLDSLNSSFIEELSAFLQ